jgi:hypothetical protein
MHEVVVHLIRIGAWIQANDDVIIADAAAFVVHLTQREMTDAIRGTGETKSAQVMEKLQEIHFVNLMVDSGTVHSFKMIACLLTSPHLVILPVLFSLQENMNFNTNNYTALFVQFLSIRDGSPTAIGVVIIDDLSAQSHGLGQILD